MGGSEAKMNDDGEPDMQPADSSMSNTSNSLSMDLGGEEKDMSPGPGEAPLDQPGVTAPKYNMNKTNESLSILGAGQPYKSNN